MPAFYSKWFFNRIMEGYCVVANPFNPKMVKTVSLLPPDVDAFVFWTRFSKPLRKRLHELDDRGFRYYFQYTLVNHGKKLESHLPPFDRLIGEFLALSEKIGPERVIWRYDPIVVGTETSFNFHIDTFGRTADKLAGATKRVVMSLADPYRKERLSHISGIDWNPERDNGFTGFISELSRIAGEFGMEMTSCSEPADLSSSNIKKGKCVDDTLLSTLFGLQVPSKKDPGQRKECCCVKSVDIGAYGTCLFGCRYCYATRSRKEALKRYSIHDAERASMMPLPA